jgi:hypothetical protein
MLDDFTKNKKVKMHSSHMKRLELTLGWILAKSENY